MLITVKKIGIGILLQIFAGATVAIGAAPIPGIGWIITGAIMAMLLYDYVTLPEKMAKKLAPSLADALSSKDSEAHAAMIRSFGDAALQEIKEEARKTPSPK